VTIEDPSQSVVDGAVDEPSCEDPAKDDALAEATPTQDTTEPERNNYNDEVTDLQASKPAMTDADVFDGELDDEFLDDVEVSSYPYSITKHPNNFDPRK
jgi:hypothetical protein